MYSVLAEFKLCLLLLFFNSHHNTTTPSHHTDTLPAKQTKNKYGQCSPQHHDPLSARGPILGTNILGCESTQEEHKTTIGLFLNYLWQTQAIN
ncbi:hypothetical protein DPEC_G00303750 [Dallia pectoralis]|uniref:Uncharacterized protein n=1 Tax=Dallia pectoralis TaxID=75939 RepID=A0ACC2FD80_DALPE|nr:hypothetical protein DPEC_G00303750 [Dallia pectoralis]